MFNFFVEISKMCKNMMTWPFSCSIVGGFIEAQLAANATYIYLYTWPMEKG
jgi:hypothetical protein